MVFSDPVILREARSYQMSCVGLKYLTILYTTVLRTDLFSSCVMKADELLQSCLLLKNNCIQLHYDQQTKPFDFQIHALAANHFT